MSTLKRRTVLIIIQAVILLPVVSKNYASAQTHSVASIPGNTISYSSPIIAEIDGDISNGKEIAVASLDGILSVVKADKTLLWSKELPSRSCRTSSNSNKVFSSPAVGELFSDGEKYVVIGYGGFGSRNCPGGVVAYKGSTGEQIWNFDLLKFAKKEKFGALSHGVFSTPALADTDNDGKMEIAFGSFDRNVYLLNADGSVRWYYNAADTIWSSASFADVNDDGKLEVIIGTDISANKFLRPPTKNGGYVYAFNTTPRTKKRIGFREKGAYYWQTYLDQVVYSSPVVADILPSSPGKEIIVGSGCYFPERNNNKKGKWIKILRLKDGRVLQTLPTSGCSPSSVAIADLNNDGALDIVANVNGVSAVGGDGKSRLFAFTPSQNRILWTTIPYDRGRNDGWGGHFQSPTIADVDGNGSLDVAITHGSGIHLFAGASGVQLTCDSSPCNGKVSLGIGASVKNSPSIGDIDGDTKFEIVGGGNSSGAALHIYSISQPLEPSFAQPELFNPLPWGSARGNEKRDGNY